MPTQTVMRALILAVIAGPLLAVTPARAGDPPSGSDEGWSFSAQGPFGFTSGGAAGSFYFQSTPGSAFNGTRGFADYSIAHGLSIGRELGIGKTQATFGVRMAEPLITNGFTPALEQRRYLGVGPRVGLQGSNPVKPSWSVDWQVGASLLYGNDAPGSNGNALPVLPNSGASAPVVNVDGLLGLSYWFNAASKLTVGYRADYLKGSPAVNFGATQSTVDHGPIVRFTIQK
jgi:hypothetical protein